MFRALCTALPGIQGARGKRGETGEIILPVGRETGRRYDGGLALSRLPHHPGGPPPLPLLTVPSYPCKRSSSVAVPLECAVVAFFWISEPGTERYSPTAVGCVRAPKRAGAQGL